MQILCQRAHMCQALEHGPERRAVLGPVPRPVLGLVSAPGQQPWALAQAPGARSGQCKRPVALYNSTLIFINLHYFVPKYNTVCYSK